MVEYFAAVSWISFCKRKEREIVILVRSVYIESITYTGVVLLYLCNHDVRIIYHFRHYMGTSHGILQYLIKKISKWFDWLCLELSVLACISIMVSVFF